MSELKLLNCPFCGVEARLYGNSKLIGTRLKHYQVAVCINDDCGCRTSPCETVEDAICRWNTRTHMANIVEKLEKLKEKGYAELTMLEVNELIDKAINIVQQEINNGLE